MNRTLPFNIEAEEVTLGSLLLDPEAIWRVAPDLTTADFYREKHRWVYQAMLNLSRRHALIDNVTLLDELEAMGKTEEAGGFQTIDDLLSRYPTAIHVEHYARMVKDYSRKRNAIKELEESLSLLYGTKRFEEVAPEVERKVFAATQARAGAAGLRHIKEYGERALDEILERASTRTRGGLNTGISDIDALLGPLRGGRLITLAARPGMGKSSMVLSIMEKVARQRANVGMFSLEMDGESQFVRLLADRAQMDSEILLNDPLSDEALEAVSAASDDLFQLPIYVDDRAGVSVHTMEAAYMRLVSEVGAVPLVVVDYIQIADDENTRGGKSRTQALGEATTALKNMARRHRCDVLMLSQLSRKVEERQNARPMLSDLRESGQIEQDSDVVAFIYRDVMYNTPTDPLELRKAQHQAEIIIAKNRNGKTAPVTVYVDLATNTWRDLERHHDDPPPPHAYKDNW